MKLALGSKLGLARKLELALGSKQVLVLELDSILVLELELGSILVLVLELGSRLVLALVLDSRLVLVHSSRCHDDDDADLLQQLEPTTSLLPSQPKLESQSSWSNLLTKEPSVGRNSKYTDHNRAVNRAGGVEWLS